MSNPTCEQIAEAREELAADVDRVEKFFGKRTAANIRIILAENEQLRADADTWRKGHGILKELRERVIPCGHKVEDLIGGDGSVTKCGACLLARQRAKTEVQLDGVYADAKDIVDNAVKANDAAIFGWIQGDQEP